MARVCFFCEKSTQFGGHRRHKYGGQWEYRATRTSRKFKINFRKVKVEKEGNGKSVDVCMKCYKKLRKSSET